jgi:hypothetical protein
MFTQKSTNTSLGLLLFGPNMRTTKLNSRLDIEPPPFGSALPPVMVKTPRSLGNLFIESFESVDLTRVNGSPFYAIGSIFRFNYMCWNQIITKIREEDRRIKGISDEHTSISEDLRRVLSLVQRGGSCRWSGRDMLITSETRESLEEDPKSAIDGIDLIWQERDRIAAIAAQKEQKRKSGRLLTAFTYMYVMLCTDLKSYSFQKLTIFPYGFLVSHLLLS